MTKRLDTRTGRDLVLTCGDSLAMLRTFDDDAFDLTLTDPPYDPKTHAHAMGKGGAGKIEMGFDSIHPAAYLADLIRVTRRWVIVFCPLEWLGVFQELGGRAWCRSGLWIRTGGAPQFSGDRPGQAGEGLAILHKLRDFAQEGERVFDPFAGSGSVGLAALRLGLRYSGVELDPKHHATATERLEEAAGLGRQLLLAPTTGKQSRLL